MTITKETVEKVATLARLELTDQESEQYTKDLANILDLVEKLNELDLDGVSADLQLDQPIVYRKDVGQRQFTRDELLANAPEKEDGFFKVPQILDSGDDE